MTTQTEATMEKATNTLGIRGFDFVEFYVGSAKMFAYWHAKAFGMDIVGYKGPETGNRDRCSYFLQKNKLKVVVTSALEPTTTEIHDFVNKHGDGVKRIAYQVDDVTKAYDHAIKNGGISVLEPHKLDDKDGVVEEAAIRLYDDTEIVYVNYDNYKGIHKPGFGEPVQNYEVHAEDTGLLCIDHTVGNVRRNEMNKWADYFNKVMDFETYVDFGPGDIATKYSALLSKVVHSKDNVIKNPINEPYEGLKKSQIEEYIQEYHGAGVQHIAIATGDIVSTIAALRKNGVEFLEVPDTYYDELRKKADKVDENIDDLQKHGILCDIDKDGSGYLLQLFTKPLSDRPTFFYEIVQRKYGSESFGKGNFQSLFESIELDQAKRGNL